jgi:hypothetical protein
MNLNNIHESENYVNLNIEFCYFQQIPLYFKQFWK